MSTKSKVLIVDDEPDIRTLVGGILEDEGYVVIEAATHSETFVQIDKEQPDLVLLDIWLENSAKDGLGILEDIQALPLAKQVPVIMMSGHGNIETAVKALQIGAYDFIEKPFKTERLLQLVSRAIEFRSLKKENKALRSAQDHTKNQEIVGISAAAESLKTMLSRIAPSNSRVLLNGEPGVGKDFIGKLIHRASARADMPFITVNCSSLRADKFDLELLGCLEGVQGEPERIGLLERANGGTLFLDEVGDIPYETQGKLVRILQEERFERIGSSNAIELDVRVIASSSSDLISKCEEGRFRKDLFYRLNVVSLNVPSLSERKDDIPMLCEAFIEDLSSKASKERFCFSQSALTALQSYSWPGNMRQLRNVIEWLTIMHGHGEGKEIEVNNLPPDIVSALPKSITIEQNVDFLDMNLKEARANFERDYLKAQIQRFNGNITKAAEVIGMERSALHRKIKLLNIVPSQTEKLSMDSDQEIVKNKASVY